MTKKSERVYVKSFGCPANLADGEVMAGCLSRAGFRILKETHNADVLIYNTCAVKAPTENRMIDTLKRSPLDKPLIVTGCLPLINFERLKAEVNFEGVTGPAPGVKIVDVVHRVNNGEKVVTLLKGSKPSLNLPKIPINPVISIIPINYGCLGACSYCCVLFARGRLRSYQLSEIVQRAKRDLDSGVKEIWLTSQDTACYGKDISTSLTALMEKICKIKGRFFVRIGMMTPNQVLEMLGELIEAFMDDKIFKFLHLPVQSGDDETLRLMNRMYTSDNFRKIVSAFRRKIPEITIATDVICGFPGESRKAFGETLRLIREIKPEVVNISKFFPRPNTPAKNMRSLSPREVKIRSKQMTELYREISLEKNKTWKSWKGVALFDKKGKEQSFLGRNFAYKRLVTKTEESLLGKFVKVRVVEANPTYLETKVIV